MRIFSKLVAGKPVAAKFVAVLAFGASICALSGCVAYAPGPGYGYYGRPAYYAAQPSVGVWVGGRGGGYYRR